MGEPEDIYKVEKDSEIEDGQETERNKLEGDGRRLKETGDRQLQTVQLTSESYRSKNASCRKETGTTLQQQLFTTNTSIRIKSRNTLRTETFSEKCSSCWDYRSSKMEFSTDVDWVCGKTWGHLACNGLQKQHSKIVEIITSYSNTFNCFSSSRTSLIKTETLFRLSLALNTNVSANCW